jgi:site-specific recombinase XerD
MPATDLALLDAPTVPATVIADELEVARHFALAEKAASTRRSYRSAFATFASWCSARGLGHMPASVDTCASFLAAQAVAGAKASTIGRKAAAIRYAHKLAGFEPPTNAETVRACMRGIRREIGTAPDRKLPATSDRIADMLRGIPETLIGKRDRALLLIGFAGALRRSELVALNVSDLVDAPDGLRITIRRSKTDQEGVGQTIAIPNGTRLRPVEAVRAWLAAAGITDGPVFREIKKGAKVQARAMSDRNVACIVKAYAERAGLDPAEHSGHSLRSGFLTSGAEAGASIWKLQEVSRHKSVDVLANYIRSADLFKDHAGAAFL